MSETVLQTGKLVKQDLGGLTKEEYYQKKCEELKLEKDGDTWEETYCWEEGYPITFDGVVYDVIEDKDENDPNYFTQLKEQPDGSYEFIALYYNGGGSLSEVLESAYDRIKKKKND